METQTQFKILPVLILNKQFDKEEFKKFKPILELYDSPIIAYFMPKQNAEYDIRYDLDYILNNYKSEYISLLYNPNDTHPLNTILHIFNTYVRRKKPINRGDITHILWFSDYSNPDEVESLVNKCKESYLSGNHKLLFKYKDDAQLTEFIVYRNAPLFLTDKMYESNIESDYNELFTRNSCYN